eukprot:356644-Chlamydomonas_euryale.AAC.1
MEAGTAGPAAARQGPPQRQAQTLGPLLLNLAITLRAAQTELLLRTNGRRPGSPDKLENQTCGSKSNVDCVFERRCWTGRTTSCGGTHSTRCARWRSCLDR